MFEKNKQRNFAPLRLWHGSAELRTRLDGERYGVTQKKSSFILEFARSVSATPKMPRLILLGAINRI
jgi:hypothetical protein